MELKFDRIPRGTQMMANNMMIRKGEALGFSLSTSRIHTLFLY